MAEHPRVSGEDIGRSVTHRTRCERGEACWCEMARGVEPQGRVGGMRLNVI